MFKEGGKRVDKKTRLLLSGFALITVACLAGEGVALTNGGTKIKHTGKPMWFQYEHWYAESDQGICMFGKAPVDRLGIKLSTSGIELGRYTAVKDC